MKNKGKKILIQSLIESIKGTTIGLYAGFMVYICVSGPFFIFGFYFPKGILVLIPAFICFVVIYYLNLKDKNIK